MYQIVYAPRVVKEDLPLLPKSAREMVERAIALRLGTAPLQYGEPLRRELVGLRRLRVSIYRVIYRVNETEHIVTIEAVGYRRDIYDQ